MGYAIAGPDNIFHSWIRHPPLPFVRPDHFVVQVDNPPNFRTTRYDGAGSIRSATAQELADVDAEQQSAKEQRELDGAKMLKAVVLWQAQLHGKTAQQARQEILAIYRTL